MKKLLQSVWGVPVLLGLVIFVLPSNLFYILEYASGYTHGLLSDYLIPRLFLSDIFLGVLAATLFWKNAAVLKKTVYRNAVPLTLWLLLAAAQLISPQPLLGLLNWFRLSLVLLTTIVLATSYPKLKDTAVVQWSLAVTILLQAGIGLWQYCTQHSVFGYLLLGEPRLGIPTGLAHSSLRSSEVILPYGTTAHPNILAGVLAVYLVLLWTKRQKLLPWPLFWLVSVLGVATLLATESFSGFLILILAIMSSFLFRQGWLEAKKREVTIVVLVMAAVITPFAINLLAGRLPENTSLTRRSYLTTATAEMLESNPITGVGLGQFTRSIEFRFITTEQVAFLQPVHNMLLLWLAETGILGCITAVAIWRGLTQFARQRILSCGLILLPVLLLDHYLLTQPAGLLLILMLLILME